jgi:hypothetical protein
MTRDLRLLVLALAVGGLACGSSEEPAKRDAAPREASALLQDAEMMTPDGAADVSSDSSPLDTASPDVASMPDSGADAAADASPDLAVDTQPDAAPDLVADCGRIKCDCTFKGKRLYGKYAVVTSFPDFKVKEVSVFEDLKVEKVTVFPDSCGEWQRDDNFPDFKIQIVDVFEDFSIRYVNVFPGLP